MIIALILSILANGVFIYKWIISEKGKANAIASQVEAEAKAVISVIEESK